MQETKKSNRILYVLEAVKSLGRAAPKDIHLRVANRLQIDSQDANFLRTIYRDLKELTDSGRLQIHHLSPDGQEIEPDEAETSAYMKVEYSVAGDNSAKFVGERLLKDLGVDLVLPKRQMSWKVSLLKNESQLREGFSLILRTLRGQVVALQLKQEDFPAKLVFARTTGWKEEMTALQEEVSEAFGPRTLCLLINDPSVSRIQVGKKTGHGVLAVDGKGKCSYEDLGSSAGTLWTSLPVDSFRKLATLNGVDKTMAQEEDPFRIERDWRKIQDEQAQLPEFFGFRVGAMIFFMGAS